MKYFFCVQTPNRFVVYSSCSPKRWYASSDRYPGPYMVLALMDREITEFTIPHITTTDLAWRTVPIISLISDEGGVPTWIVVFIIGKRWWKYCWYVMSVYHTGGCIGRGNSRFQNMPKYGDLDIDRRRPIWHCLIFSQSGARSLAYNVCGKHLKSWRRQHNTESAPCSQLLKHIVGTSSVVYFLHSWVWHQILVFVHNILQPEYLIHCCVSFKTSFHLLLLPPSSPPVCSTSPYV